jgi:GAF domain-containing protein
MKPLSRPTGETNAGAVVTPSPILIAAAEGEAAGCLRHAGKGTLPDPESLPVLLRISTAIATIRERKELFAAILEQIKPAIPVDDTGILVLNEPGTRWQDWTNADHYQNHPSSAQLQQLGYHEFQPLDRFTEYTLNHSGIMTVAQFREQYPEHPFGAVMWEAGLREMMFTPLVTGGRKLGVLFFDSQREGTYTKGHLALFKAIAGQVAVAVANILANEEILEREREKALLLSLSEDMATIRDRDDLWRVMMEKIKPLVGFDDAVLLILTEDLTEYSFVLTMSPTERQAHALYSRVVGNNKVADSPVPWYLKQPTDLFVQDLQALEADPAFPAMTRPCR